MRARWYDPGTGQFLTQDPLWPLTTNPYAYVADNPLNFVDASGLCAGPQCTLASYDIVHYGVNLGCTTHYPVWEEGVDVAWMVGSAFGAGDVVESLGLVDLLDGERAGAAVPRILANQTAGNAARDSIAAANPSSEIEQTFQTTLGARRVDVLTQDGLAIESKVGYTSLSQSVQLQIAKDQLLMENGDVSGVQWIFNRSGVTGAVGPSGPLAAALDEAGISWSIGP